VVERKKNAVETREWSPGIFLAFVGLRHTTRREQATNAWFHNPSNPLFTNHSIIQSGIILATESIA
jgi:hypothetical protein